MSMDRPVALLKRQSVVAAGCDPRSNISNEATSPAISLTVNVCPAIVAVPLRGFAGVRGDRQHHTAAAGSARARLHRDERRVADRGPCARRRARADVDGERVASAVRVGAGRAEGKGAGRRRRCRRRRRRRRSSSYCSSTRQRTTRPPVRFWRLPRRTSDGVAHRAHILDRMSCVVRSFERAQSRVPRQSATIRP